MALNPNGANSNVLFKFNNGTFGDDSFIFSPPGVVGGSTNATLTIGQPSQNSNISEGVLKLGNGSNAWGHIQGSRLFIEQNEIVNIRVGINSNYWKNFQFLQDGTLLIPTRLGFGSGTPNDSAILDLNNYTYNKGFLPPVMTTVQKLAIINPAEGLTVYDSTLKRLSFYDGTQWTV